MYVAAKTHSLVQWLINGLRDSCGESCITHRFPSGLATGAALGSDGSSIAIVKRGTAVGEEGESGVFFWCSNVGRGVEIP